MQVNVNKYRLILRKIKIASPAILVMLFMNLSCWESKRINNREIHIRAVRLFYKCQLGFNGELTEFGDSLTIYYLKDFILYRVAFPFEQKYLTFDSSGNISSERLIMRGTKFSYFIYKKGAKFGFNYDSIDAKTGRRCSTDSFLRAKFSFTESIFENSNETLINRKTGIPHYDLMEVYTPKIKYDDTYPDSSYYYYLKKLTDIEFSFSHELDSIKKMKLCKVRFVYNPVTKGTSPFAIPKREFLFQIEELSILNQTEISDLSERFQRSAAAEL